MSKHRRWFKVTAANGTQIDMYFIQDIDANQTPAELTRDYQSENIYLRIDESQHDITRFASLVIVGRSDEIVASVDITYANDTIIDGIEQRTTNTNPMFQVGLVFVIITNIYLYLEISRAGYLYFDIQSVVRLECMQVARDVYQWKEILRRGFLYMKKRKNILIMNR